MTTPVSESSDVEDRPSVQHQGALEIAQIMAAQGRFSLFERQRILGVLLPRQDAAAIIRFSIMLALSVAIAVMGLSADSSAVVIGAMLVAPLMSPIFTFSAAVGLGLPRRAGQAALIVALGSAGSVLLAIALAQMLPDVDLSAEVLSRTRAALGSAKSGPAVVRIEAAMLAGWLLCVLPPSLGCRGRGYGLLLGAWRELEDGALSDSRLPGQRDRLRINAAWLLLRSSPRAVPVADSDAPGRDVLVARICCLDPACSFAEVGDDDGRPNEPA